jgi:hypothetical protein
MTSKIEKALAAIGRRFIGGYRTRDYVRNSRWMPHQGKREIARRLRQEAKRAA